MDLHHLQLFVEVVRRGSFAAVARDHRSAPSSISRAVRSLEEALGVRLFQRSTRRLELTEAGRGYFASVEGLVEELQRAAEVASKLTETPSGTLRITASATFGQVGIVPLLPAFTQRYPQLAIELLLTDTRLDLVADRIDVAIRLGPLTDSTYIASRLHIERYVICATPHYLAHHGRPTCPAELSRHNTLHLPLPEFDNWQFRAPNGRIEKVAVQSRLLISNAQALKQCALAHMGIALLPRWVVTQEERRGELERLLPEYAVGTSEFEIPVWLLYPSRRYLPLKVRAFAEFMRDAFRHAAPWESD